MLLGHLLLCRRTLTPKLKLVTVLMDAVTFPIYSSIFCVYHLIYLSTYFLYLCLDNVQIIFINYYP